MPTPESQSPTATSTGASPHPADRLLDAVAKIGAPVCVGLDPVLDRLPAACAPRASTDAEACRAIGAFSRGVIDAVAGRVPCVKIQAACYERYRADGVRVLVDVLAHAAERDLQVILDAKRGDIGISAAHYAHGAFGATPAADWLTINGYLGADAIAPFVIGRGGAFVLVRTSNPGSDAIQRARLADGRTVAELLADTVATAGAATIGRRGYSRLGAVVGATKAEDAAGLRRRMPAQLFLVPGYGAQGGAVADVLPCFNADGTGAIVTASRSVIYAFEPSSRDWAGDVARAAERFADEVRRGVGAG